MYRSYSPWVSFTLGRLALNTCASAPLVSDLIPEAPDGLRVRMDKNLVFGVVGALHSEGRQLRITWRRFVLGPGYAPEFPR